MKKLPLGSSLGLGWIAHNEKPHSGTVQPLHPHFPKYFIHFNLVFALSALNFPIWGAVHMRDHLGYEDVFPIWYQNCNKKLSDVSRNVRTPERIICMATSMNCEIFSLQVIKKLSPEMSGPKEYIHRHLKYQLHI